MYKMEPGILCLIGLVVILFIGWMFSTSKWKKMDSDAIVKLKLVSDNVIHLLSVSKQDKDPILAFMHVIEAKSKLQVISSLLTNSEAQQLLGINMYVLQGEISRQESVTMDRLRE